MQPEKKKIIIMVIKSWKSSGCPVVRYLHCWGPGSFPGQRTKIPQVTQYSQKNTKNKKQRLGVTRAEVLIQLMAVQTNCQQLGKSLTTTGPILFWADSGREVPFLNSNTSGQTRKQLHKCIYISYVRFNSQSTRRMDFMYTIRGVLTNVYTYDTYTAHKIQNVFITQRISSCPFSISAKVRGSHHSNVLSP